MSLIALLEIAQQRLTIEQVKRTFENIKKTHSPEERKPIRRKLLVDYMVQRRREGRTPKEISAEFASIGMMRLTPEIITRRLITQRQKGAYIPTSSHNEVKAAEDQFERMLRFYKVYQEAGSELTLPILAQRMGTTAGSLSVRLHKARTGKMKISDDLRQRLIDMKLAVKDRENFGPVGFARRSRVPPLRKMA